ncbi:MAG: mechanosensitive ion channel domain-containing protein [Cyanobacteria bacterium J06592_8]
MLIRLSPTLQSNLRSTLNQVATVLKDTEIEGNFEIIVASSVEGLYNLQDISISQKIDQSEGADKSEFKRLLINKVTELQAERAAIIERFETVLNELEIKGGEVKAYREYINGVSSFNINLQDAEGLSARLIVWLTSPEGGIRWVIRLIVFTTIVAASVFISRILARIVNKALLSFGDTSDLFRDFVVMLVQRGGIVMGGLIGLTTLGVSLGPMLALVGGTSFILAFALQSNLSNLASGLMLMVYKPFDTGDEVKIGDIWGYVDSITLASTRIKGWSSEMITMPNDTVWSSIIKNLTAEEIRKGIIAIRVPFNQSISEVEKVLVEMGESHPLVLTGGTFIWEYAEYYVTVNFTFSTKTSDFWTVWAELHRTIQQRFDQEGLSIALPTAIEIEGEPHGKMPQQALDSVNSSDKLVKPQS